MSGYKSFSSLRQQMDKNKNLPQNENVLDTEENKIPQKKKRSRQKPGEANNKKVAGKTAAESSQTNSQAIVNDSQNIVQNTSISGSVRKTIAIPLEMDLAIRELKEQRKLKRKLTNRKGRDTDDDIFLEALQILFTQNGEFSESIKTARQKLKNLNS